MKKFLFLFVLAARSGKNRAEAVREALDRYLGDRALPAEEGR